MTGLNVALRPIEAFWTAYDGTIVTHTSWNNFSVNIVDPATLLNKVNLGYKNRNYKEITPDFYIQ